MDFGIHFTLFALLVLILRIQFVWETLQKRFFTQTLLLQMHLMYQLNWNISHLFVAHAFACSSREEMATTICVLLSLFV